MRFINHAKHARGELHCLPRFGTALRVEVARLVESKVDMWWEDIQSCKQSMLLAVRQT